MFRPIFDQFIVFKSGLTFVCKQNCSCPIRCECKEICRLDQNKNRHKQTQTNTSRHTQTQTDRIRHKQTKTDQNRPKQTQTDPFSYAHTVNVSYLSLRMDICNAKNWTYRMCPRCNENFGCKYWDLKKSCTLAKVNNVDFCF